MQLSPHAPPLRTSQRISIVTLQQRRTPAEEAAAKKAAQEALERANAKLEELNQVEKLAPTSWADLGVPKEAEPDDANMQMLSVAPLVVGAFSATLFTLNLFGLFGDGPDLDALVDEWSKL